VTSVKDALLEKTLARRARIGIIGLGYVGLPLVLRFGDEGFPVMGFDVDPSKVSRLNRGESYIRHIAADRVLALVNKKQFEATSDFTRLSESDCIIICVPTPLTAKGIRIFNTSKVRQRDHENVAKGSTNLA
jgi:UDP-N-acetyl-D-glucosamine dehydrogenase